ncbi:hypothetical protein FJZ36_14335 [Candidatus Poribacteria bacterium]|nr:hypothetical protein [Candidatus Poribacteria bacterium]
MPLTVIRMARPSTHWQETYVRLAAGNRLVVDAEGAWSPDLRNRIGWCGGDGVPGLIAGDEFLMPGANVGALIARIGNGKPFAVGARYDNIVREEGVLFIAMNENPKHNNQAGFLMAQFIVFGEGES